MAYDDLTRIKGINQDRAIYFDSTVPRYLGEPAEYATYDMLAALYPSDFAEMLSMDEANRNVTLLESWPKQAVLAAACDWDTLEKLHATLPDWQ